MINNIESAKNLPYITHLMECGFILSGITINNDTTIEEFFSDTIEDTYIDYQNL